MIEAIKNWKLHILVLIFVIIAEWIGAFPSHRTRHGGFAADALCTYNGNSFGAQIFEARQPKDMVDAGSLVGVTLMLLMAKYGTAVGPNIPMILRTSPALILQEFGNLARSSLVYPWRCT